MLILEVLQVSQKKKLFASPFFSCELYLDSQTCKCTCSINYTDYFVLLFMKRVNTRAHTSETHFPLLWPGSCVVAEGAKTGISDYLQCLQVEQIGN
jgi:hypothetical protein